MWTRKTVLLITLELSEEPFPIIVNAIINWVYYKYGEAQDAGMRPVNRKRINSFPIIVFIVPGSINPFTRIRR